MISTSYRVQNLNGQTIQQQSKKPLTFFEFTKEFVPYTIIGMAFLGLSDVTRHAPAEKVVWVVSKAFEGSALATMMAWGVHFLRLCLEQTAPNRSLKPDRVAPLIKTGGTSKCSAACNKALS